MEYKDPGRYIPIIFLLYSWGSRFGVPGLGFPVKSLYLRERTQAHRALRGQAGRLRDVC